jgi:hypothetical protein
MSMAEATAPPARMHIIDLSTGEDLEVFFNPEQIQEQIEVAYNRLTVPGMSHQPLQYSHTGNHGVNVDLYAVGQNDAQNILIEDFRRFLMSLCYPKGDAGTIDDGAPPRVLFVWPLVWTWTAVVTGLKITSSQFAQNGRISRYIASLSFEEIRDVRLTSDDVRRHGTRRSASGGGVESA